MKNADMPAMPVCSGSETSVYNGVSYTKNFLDGSGLTKREEMLGRFMEAMLSNPDMRYDPKGLADDASDYVDAYFEKLAELERTK